MAAHLYPGVKSLQLVLDKPYDTIRTTDIRDDLASVKVWYSLTSGFNPNNGEGTLVPSGNSLNVPITELLPGTRYYVKYAFISSIDEDEIDPAGPTGPGSFTISPELTAVVYSDTENVTIYGYLTNDPVPVVTATDGTGGDFTQATGVFKVFNLTEDVTGAGPVYAIKAGSLDSIVGAAIDAVTGVYSCTELTDDGGNVTFTATYNDVVIEQVWNVYRALAGETAPLIQLSTPNKEFIYKDQFATVSLTPSSTITARLVNLSGTITWTAQAYTREGVSLGTVAYTQNGNAITITQAQFDALGITLGTVKVTATIGSVSDVITLYRINDGTEQITVTLSNEAHVIPAYADGTTTPNSYVGSGTIIEVKQGITTLPVDNSSPFANGSWRVTTITADGIVCDITPAVGATSIEYDRHASMDNARDVATIDYTITGKTTSGVAFTIVKRQSFAKSKEGVQGATARSVSLTSTGQAFVTAQNTTTVTPDTVTLTATQSNFVSPTYTWLVDGVAPTVAIGVATGNTFVLNKFDPLAVKVVKVTVSEGTFSVFDTFSVYSFREGDDAFIVGLKNESQTISCDSAGEIIDGQFPFTTQMYALLGGRLLTSSTTPGPAATFAKVSYNGGTDSTYRISADGIITIDSLDEQFGEAVFSATVNGVTLTKTLNLNKSFDGSDAAVVNVTATTQAFIAAKNTGTISPATVTLTANTYNVGATPTYTWKKSTDGGTVFTTAQTGSSSTFSLASFASGNTIVKVEVSGGASTVFDQITIYALKEGSDSISVGLINENQTISCDSAGTPIAGQFNLNSELVVFRGTTKLTSADGVVWSKVAGSEVGMASTIVTTTGAITVTGISATTASSTYRAAVTVGGVTTNFDKTFTLNKSNNGAAGAAVFVATVYRQIASAPTTPTGGSYNFSTNTLTAPTSWSALQPATTTTPTYACDYTFSGAPGSTIDAGTWGTPYIEAVNGTNGEYRDTIQLYISSFNTPTKPTSVQYTFTGNVLGTVTGGTAGWSNSQPSASSTVRVWVVKALANTTTPGTAITLTSWSDPVVVAQNGAAGNATFVGTVYLQNASAPTTPTGGSYNFSTNTLTAPAGGWSALQPATTTTPTYACDYTFSGAPGSTIDAGTWGTPYIEAVNGRNGEYRDTIQLFLSNSTVPTKPTSVQYTFTGNVLGTVTGGTAGWSATQPAPTVSPVYMTSALASTTTPGTALSLTSWSDPVVVAQNGRSVYSATVYRQIASVPTTPSGGSYHFGTNTLTAPTDWSATQPASSTIPTYASDFTFSSTASNASVNAGSWGAPYIEAVNGSPGNNGEYRDTIQLFQAATSTPTQPSSASYTFTGNVLGTISGATGTWTLAQPATTPTTPVYMTRALANTTTPGTALSLTSWSAPVIIAQNGAKGDTGNPIFVGTVYLQTTGSPTRPSGGSFNFSTSTLTAPAGGWSASQPATTTTPTYACDFTFTGAAGSTVTAGTWSIPYIEAVNGIPGSNGEYRDTIQLFLSSASVPTKPSSVPYTFTGNVLGTVSGGTAGWTQTQPASSTTPVYMTKALASTTTPGTAVTLTSWTTPVVISQNGAKGDTGNPVFIGTVYRQIATVPGAPSGGSFNFSTSTLTAPADWTAAQPATTTTPTYACNFTFTGAAGSTVTAGTWSTPYIEAVNGLNGEYRDTLQLFLAFASAPTQPTSVPYTFTTNTIGTLNGGTAGWTLVQPTPTSTTPVYMTRALAATTTPGIALTVSSWSVPVIVAQSGVKGDPGTTGSSAVVMYARIANNPTPNPSGTLAVTGSVATKPTGLAASYWGAAFNVTWSDSDPVPTSTNSLYMSNGTFNGTNSTVWSAPYLASLKVGSLEAITTSTGSLNVTGTFKTSTGSPVAPTGVATAMTGYGSVIKSDGTFALGNATTSITFNGTQLTLNGNVVNTANIAPNSITGSGSSTVVSSMFTSTTLNFNVVIPSDCFLFLLWVDGGEYLYASTSGSGESTSSTAGVTNVLYTLTAGNTRIIPESTEALALASGAHHWSAISPLAATYAMVLTMTRPELNTSASNTRNTKARVSWLILKK
jgi:hypothetical protein